MGRRVLVLVLVSLVSACSFRKLAISQAGWLTVHQIDKYFDLESDQEKALRVAVDADLQLIKKQLVPRVNQDLKSLAEKFADGISAEEIAWASARFYAYRQELGEVLVPDAAKFLASLKSAQVAHLEEYLADSNADESDDLTLDDAAYLKKRRVEIVKQIEYWVGDLTDEQEVHVVGVMSVAKSNHKEWFTKRLASQKSFAALLRQNLGPERLQAQLVEWSAHPGKLWDMSDAEMAAQRDERLQRYERVAKILTPKQVDHLVSEILQLRDDLSAE